jgi:hypothetical protein
MQWNGDVLLRPAEGEAWYFQEGVLAQDLATQDWGKQWVRVTGHFADPASDTCAWGPEYGDPFYNTPETAVTWCRQRFVITAIASVESP